MQITDSDAARLCMLCGALRDITEQPNPQTEQVLEVQQKLEVVATRIMNKIIKNKMKHLISISFMVLCCLFCSGQTGSKLDTIMVLYQYSDTSLIQDFGEVYYTLDTIAEVPMLVPHFDTSMVYYDNKVRWSRGYSVREKISLDWQYYFGGKPEIKYVYKHLYYLDKEKNRLDKNIYVWTSQSIE